ncbi:MAG: glycoside hydrolase family 3 C-terminal domain-containing protein, partial [Proteobacteria bacterium]|nr:glycoside hydrolase family 3 C-terminal domain-containing protein [Pseudomonadota bacterium]
CEAGLDVEAPDTVQFGKKLVSAVTNGDVSLERVDDAVQRVLRTLFQVLAAPDPEEYSADVVACEEHVSLAREAAAKSIVLLKNDGELPWRASSLERILVLGELADTENLGDRGSSRVYPPDATAPLDGLLAACEGLCEVEFDTGADLDRVRELASNADAVLVVAGYTHKDEGEFIPGGMSAGIDAGENGAIGGDRVDLGLPQGQISLIQAAAEAHPNVTVAVMSGSAVMMEAWKDCVSAILMIWYPGMRGGEALADVLLGHVNPSGRLPFSIPVHTSDLPFFDRDATEITYDLWHGYTKLEREEAPVAFPFGFGLSYTTFDFSDPSASYSDADDTIHVSVDVKNTGKRRGETVVQVYAGWSEPNPRQPRKRLCGFSRAELSSGERRTITVAVRLRDLAWFDSEAHIWTLGTHEWRVWIGSSSAERDLVATPLHLPDRTWDVREH